MRPRLDWRMVTGAASLTGASGLAWWAAAAAAGHRFSLLSLAACSVLLPLATGIFAARPGWAGAWLAPLALLLGEGSAASALPACLLAAGLAGVAGSARLFPWAQGAAMLIHAGALAYLAGNFWLGAGLAGGAGWIARHVGGPRLSATPALLLAILFTGAALLPYLGFGGGGDSNAAEAGDETGPAVNLTGTTGEVIGDGSHNGVILWPESTPHTVLVPPLPKLDLSFSKPQQQPEKDLRIPFYGVYWMYKAPHRRPPPNSFVTRGNPTATSFRAADHASLQMEARQNFGTMISTRCCARIELEIRNGDPYVGTVALELLLVNTALPGAPALSLGTAPVRSGPRWRPGRKMQVYEETLSYTMPPGAALVQFDEAVVRFHRHKLRAERSARVSIERFGLIRR